MAIPSAAFRTRSNPESSVIRMLTVAAVAVNRRTVRRIRSMTASSTSDPTTTSAMLNAYDVTCIP
jgi:hypothetical protein